MINQIFRVIDLVGFPLQNVGHGQKLFQDTSRLEKIKEFVVRPVQDHSKYLREGWMPPSPTDTIGLFSEFGDEKQ
jgi:hypothetical protein